MIERQKNRAVGFGVKNTENFLRVLDAFYLEPTLTVGELAEATDLSLSSIYKIVERLTPEGLIDEVSGRERGKINQTSDYIVCFA